MSPPKKKKYMEKLKKKIFISHSSIDKTIISDFVEQVLILGLGINQDEIAYTSEEPLGVIPGEDIKKYIKDNIVNASIVLIMISPNYKHSEICLNEMGAAWALDKKCISVLLPGVDFDQLGWLTSMEKAVKMTEKSQIDNLCATMASHFAIDMNLRFKHMTAAVDKFIRSHDKVVFKTAVEEKQNTIRANTDSLRLFDSSFTSLYIEEGKYIIQLTMRIRADKEPICIRRILLRNKYSFTGAVSREINMLCFKLYMHPDIFDLSSQQDEAEDFVKHIFQENCKPILDTTIKKGHNFSCSFIQLFHTIRQSDGYDELQLHGWELVVEYNVDSEAVFPLTLNPVDKEPSGKYWHNI